MGCGLPTWAQAPGTTPVEISHKTQMLHGRKYYVHIVKTGQTVYSIAKAYKVESYDAVTHVDIHFMHAGDTVWLPCRGQFSVQAEEVKSVAAEVAKEEPKVNNPPASRPATEASTMPKSKEQARSVVVPPSARPTGKVLKVALMMPLHLGQIDEISTTKFDVEQRGKKSYRQFEFIEFYEGVSMALEKLAEEGVCVELNVVDVPDNTVAQAEEAFASHRVGESDVVVALLLRDAFDKVAALAQQAGVYVVNPMATRSAICAANPYAVKIQPSVSGMIATVLRNMKLERPDGHLYVLYSGGKEEKEILEEVKRQLAERGDIKYTLFNWSQNAKLGGAMKSTPNCSMLSLYDQGKDLNRVYVSNLLNRLSSVKSDPPVLYTLADWTREYADIDFGQLQHVNYHTFATAWDMTNEVHVDFLKDFRLRYGSEPTSILAATGYDLTLYIVRGLHRLGGDFWNTSTAGVHGLTQPLRLVRSGAGLENERATLYRMEALRLVPAPIK